MVNVDICIILASALCRRHGHIRAPYELDPKNLTGKTWLKALCHHLIPVGLCTRLIYSTHRVQRSQSQPFPAVPLQGSVIQCTDPLSSENGERTLTPRGSVGIGGGSPSFPGLAILRIPSCCSRPATRFLFAKSDVSCKQMPSLRCRDK